ncbi:MAG TPA: prolyl oligopeptidase family serine peptidase [Thermoanaerobaculia bacterium]|nr:prolyl oligopeptidase family serine peptidase [Thermoanaerobaculia bacterium]
MHRLFITLFAIALASTPALSQDDSYKVPPKDIIDVVDAPLTPTLVPGWGDWGVLYEPPLLLTVSDLSQPELKLAGLRFNPRSHEQTRAPYGRDLRLLRFSSGEQRAISGLPSPLRARNVTWSPDGARLAFSAATAEGVELWVVDAATASARRVGSLLLNASSPSRPFHWLSDSASILARTVPSQRGAEPVEPRVPAGPVIQENAGRRTPARTYQDLLKGPYDAALYEHHVQSQLALVTLEGTTRLLGTPALIVRAEPSPDANYFLVESVHRPFSYVVPEFRFPRRIEVWDREGTVVREVADLPLADAVATDFDAVREGPRSAGWRADRPATLYWVEALDKGNARSEAALRDRIVTLASPFRGEPQQLVTLALRFRAIQWESDDLALVEESWWKTRRTRTWRVRPGQPDAKPELIFDRSSEDRYADPGNPVVRANGQGVLVLRRTRDTIFLFGQGASPEGNRPFVDSLNLKTKRAARLWQSEAPHYEFPVMMRDDRTVITRRESVNTPPNYFRRDLRAKSMRALTSFPHPTPQLAAVQKELIRYKRADGIDLTATLYLPPGYDAARDGRLPVLMWAYPTEFKSASAAGQVTDSPYRFVRVSPMSPLPWLVRGYAILDDPSIPIVGEGDREPNDTYVDQLVAGAKAAIDEVVRRGVGDRDRIAIGGHSYGAFMAANLLAHSDLFRAGIARSGAYNRTLTPFSFQAEERTFWQAADTYMRMSPFTHADKINEPLLMTHGVDDNNTGTFPIQSERLFAAMKGLGGTVRLVMLPFESHGYRARESVMHMLWEIDRWLETYVKTPKRE